MKYQNSTMSDSIFLRKKTVILIALMVSMSVLKKTAAELPAVVNQSSTASADDSDDPINWPVDKFTKTVKKQMDAMFKNALPSMMAMSDGISPKCASSLMVLANGLRKLKYWSFQMLDAASKAHPGMLMGTAYGFGSYDECVDIVVKNEKSPRKEIFRGQYCLVALNPPNSLMRPLEIVANASGIKDFESTVFSLFPLYSEVREGLKMGTSVCFPSTCSTDDIENVFRRVVRPLGFSASVFNCEIKRPPRMDTVQIIVSCIFASLAVFSVLGTLLDAVSPYFAGLKVDDDAESSWKKTSFRIMREFSVYSNTKKFLKGPNRSGKLDVLAGMRFFSTTWVIIGHSFFVPDIMHFTMLKDMNTLFEYQYDLSFMAIQNMALSIDTFFVISGFLTTFNSLKTMQKENGRLPPFKFIMKRVMRLQPSQFLVIGLLMLMPLFGDGPLWTQTWKPKIQSCKKYWWTNLLFLQNFCDMFDSCLFHSWYIAVLMQLHVITFFLLILFYKKPVLGVSVSIALGITSCLAISLVTFLEGYPATFDSDLRANAVYDKFLHNVYGQLYSHIATYFTGVLLAFTIVKYPGVKLPRPQWRILAWMCATAAALASLYGLYAFTGYVWIHQHPFARIFYAGMHRLSWAVCIAWVIYDCILHPKGIVSSILSWKPLIHLDSLALLAYLVHPLVIEYHQARLREHLNSDYVDMIYYCIGNIVLAYMVSFLLHVTIEQPINSLDAALFKKHKLQKSDLESQEKSPN